MLMTGVSTTSSQSASTLFPVVLKVPESVQGLAPLHRGRVLGLLARQSVLLSARQAGLTIGGFLKGDGGRPLPWRGVHWSLTHKPFYVAGVVSFFPVGIDLETVKSVSTGVFHRICPDEEAALFHGVPRETAFFRCFTAKEAVLKRHGVGLAGLNAVSVRQVPGAMHLDLYYKGAFSPVEHFWVDGHVVSIAGDRTDVIWTTVMIDAHGRFISE